MPDKFRSLDARERAALQSALNRCRALTGKIGNELRNKRPEDFVDKLSLADFCASLERAVDFLESVPNTPARTPKRLQVRGRLRHR
jgi:hypothetical protein